MGGAASSVLTGLFDETSPDETAEQREAKRNIITSLVTGIAALRDPGDATTASGAATANVDNNWLATQQKVQRDKEYAQAASPLEQLAVMAKWSRVDLGQDVDTGVGIAKGLKDGLAGTGLETLNGLANFMRDPVEQWNNLVKLASTDAIKQALGDGYEAFQAEVQLVQKQLETGGGDNAEALGHRMGSIFAVVLATVSTGGASTARAGQVLDDIGIVVRSSKTAQVIAASKGKTLTYLERLKRDGHDSDVPDIAGGEKATSKVIAQYGPMNQGPLPKGFADTFRSGTYSEVVTQQPTTLYRVYGGTANELGGYWTATRPAGPVQSIIDSALDPKWGNTATNVVKIEVPIGIKYFEGVAAPQGGLVGGGNQVLFPKDVKIDASWIRQ